MNVKSLSMQSDYATLLASIFYFMRKSGLPKGEVSKICRQALVEANNGNGSETSRGPTLAAAALTLDAWHRDRRYLEGVQPRAIPLLGVAPSVEALIRSQDVHDDPSELALRLKSLGLVVRAGRNRYMPSDRIALVSGLDPIIQQYVARASATLLATIKHNTSRARNSSRLIERFAEVPDLPRSKVAEFRRFAQIQGRAFLGTLNDWLESRRRRGLTPRNERTVRAGVHLYAYVDASQTGESSRKRRQGRTISPATHL